MLTIFILYGSLILMNLLVALMVSKTDSEKAEVSLIKQRIEEISGATDISRAIKVLRKKKDDPKLPPIVCVRSSINPPENRNILTCFQDYIDNKIFMGTAHGR